MALIAGPAAYAPIAATFVLFAPLRIGVLALMNMLQPEIARHLAEGDAVRARTLPFRCSWIVALVCTAYTTVVLFALPPIERHLFAGRFADAPMSVIALAVGGIVTVAIVHYPLRVLLEAYLKFRQLAGLMAVSAVVGTLAVVGLLLSVDPNWSLLGVLLSELVMLDGCYRLTLSSRHGGNVPI